MKVLLDELLPEVNMMTSGSAAVTFSAIGSTTRRAPGPATALRQPVGPPNLAQGGKFVPRHGLQVVEVAVAAEFGDAIRTCTEAMRSCAMSSRGCSSVLSGTSTAPMRVSAIAICTHPTPLGMIRPTRVPLSTPASTKAAAISRVVASRSP